MLSTYVPIAIDISMSRKEDRDILRVSDSEALKGCLPR